jgi:hypothetical protein
MRTVAQGYPRIDDRESSFNGFLDDNALQEHIRVITASELKQIVKKAIEYANKKSGRAILDIPENATAEQLEKIYKDKGKKLFDYFRKFCGDPASSAFACIKRHYKIIGKEQFRNWTLQKERMNSGWRYQYIAKDAAIHSKRFVSVSDIGTAEADFNAIIFIKNSEKTLNIYVSVKNRMNTMGGQDWPKAIHALEGVAKKDKNRTGPYICVFGIAMEKGLRNIKYDGKTKTPHSVNTEIWKSDFFWPFFSNHSYNEIIRAVLEVLMEVGEANILDMEIPEELLDAFGSTCEEYGLLDDNGYFNDAHKLVDLFCGQLKLEKKEQQKNKKIVKKSKRK